MKIQKQRCPGEGLFSNFVRCEWKIENARGRVSVRWVPSFHVAVWQLGRGPGQTVGGHTVRLAGRGGVDHADQSVFQRRIRFWL